MARATLTYSGRDGRFQVLKMSAAQVHVLPDADAQCRRAYDCKCKDFNAHRTVRPADVQTFVTYVLPNGNDAQWRMLTLGPIIRCKPSVNTDAR